MPKYNRHTRHSDNFYRTVLQTIITGFERNESRDAICSRLKATGLPSPTGSPWTIAALAGVLARIRAGSGHHYVALLRGVFDGIFTKEQARLVLRIL